MSSHGSNEPEIIDLTILSDSSSADGDSATSGPLCDFDSDASEVEIHLDAETRTQLKSAVDTIPAVRLREVLVRMIETEPAVEIALSKELITVNRETRTIVPRWEICPNCQEYYDINTQKKDGECQFHPGELEVNEAAFTDHGEDGPMDTEENRTSFPQELIWTCCRRQADGPGCVRDQHQASVLRNRRRL